MKAAITTPTRSDIMFCMLHLSKPLRIYIADARISPKKKLHKEIG
jgi:hypothetical protein